MICGIVAEYNPFHLGHKYQLETLRASYGANLIVVVMSGHFLQRGIPAIIDKWKRAEMAVRNGADLVVELPVEFSNSSSDIFAMGAVKTLSTLNVETISFGAEAENIPFLFDIAELSLSPEYDKMINYEKAKGLSGVAAGSIVMSKMLGKNLPLDSNSILGVSYIRAIKKLSLNYDPVIIKRKGSKYLNTDINTAFPSANAIRKALSQKLIDWSAIRESMPESSYSILKSYNKYVFSNDFSEQILSKIYSLRKDGLLEIRGVGEGIENRVIKIARENKKFDDMVTAISSKRYTESTVRRLLINILLGIKKVKNLEDVSRLDYRRVLAMSEAGKKHLKILKKNKNINLLVNFAKDIKKNNLSSESLDYDISATSLYSLVSEEIDGDSDFVKKPFIME